LKTTMAMRGGPQDAVRESGGAAVAVSDAELIDAGVRLASDEEIDLARS
jgi:hypothetical protein